MPEVQPPEEAQAPPPQPTGMVLNADGTGVANPEPAVRATSQQEPQQRSISLIGGTDTAPGSSTVETPVDAAYHFTYQRPSCEDLQQGDLIEKRDGIAAILQEIHPHYGRKEDYTHLLVLTQTCDLVRRDGNACKARYISLAAVRPLSTVIRRELEKHQDKFERIGMLCSVANKSKMEQFVDRLLNNNEPDYFYLHADEAHGFFESSCAFLRLSVAVRAGEHYATILSSRSLSLKEVFQAKLGWLVGNMYSRVGTQDWVPDNAKPNDYRQLRDRVLREHCIWEDANKLKVAKDLAAVYKPEELTMESVRKLVNTAKVKRNKDQAIDAVVRLLETSGFVKSAKDIDSIKRMLTNSPDFSKNFK